MYESGRRRGARGGPWGCDGFSLVELSIGLALLGILLAIGVTSFRSLVQRSRIRTFASEFMATANLARSEAARRSTHVTICRSANGATCATSGAWSQGWIVFTDPNATAAAPTFDAGEEILQVHGALTVGSAATTLPNTRLTYDPLGVAEQSGTITLCNPGTKAIVIDLATTGRLRIQEGTQCP